MTTKKSLLDYGPGLKCLREKECQQWRAAKKVYG